jgi:hypothetical protein
MRTFIGATVEVEAVQELGWQRPVRFRLDGVWHDVAGVEERWEDHGFPAAAPRRPRWYHRRHRTGYRVRTAGGALYTLYWDRGGPSHRWVLAAREE